MCRTQDVSYRGNWALLSSQVLYKYRSVLKNKLFKKKESVATEIGIRELDS